MSTLDCCRHIAREVRGLPSPFGRLIATDYYDGPTDGFVECRTCRSLYLFSKLDWDDHQDMRVFSLAPVPGRSLGEIERGTSGGSKRTWPAWILVGEIEREIGTTIEGFEAAALPVDFVIAAEDLLGTIEVWRPAEPSDVTDWFAEFGLARQDPGRR